MSINALSIKFFLLALLLLGLPLSAQAALAIQHWQTAQGARVVFVESRELPILDISDFSMVASCSGELPTTSTPEVNSFSFTSG